uniref:Thrombospondin type 1 domain protein n=1 Tax=Romanomermis culicivorax TaxID=13658 RepID=A0A915J3N2_ROMCU
MYFIFTVPLMGRAIPVHLRGSAASLRLKPKPRNLIEPCSQPQIACKRSCHAGYWSSWSPCRVNCSRQKWAPDVERVPLSYACFAECNQTGVTFRERVSFMVGGIGDDKVDAQHCPVEYVQSNCSGVCGGASAHLYPQPFGVAEYDTATETLNCQFPTLDLL